MSKHTPGPWVVLSGDVCTKQGTVIASPDREERRTAPVERDANARLIAAAPDLLAALEEVVICRERCQFGLDGAEGFAMALEAIKKAKGE